MELRTGVYIILHFFGVSTVISGTKHASVGLIENAPRYGTYEHRSSKDQYMDPCKACKFIHKLRNAEVNYTHNSY